MNFPKLPLKRDTQIFISYATEDALVATAIETAFLALNDEDAPTLKIKRDIHSLKQGLRLTETILEDLGESDILFVIFTERLKSSHSFTGFEVGAFSSIIRNDKKLYGKTDRRIVSLFLDVPPPTEEGVLGIKLDAEALGSTTGTVPAEKIDPDGQLSRFLVEVSDLMVSRRFEYLFPEGGREKELNKAKENSKENVEKTIIPNLEKDLISALSKIVAKNYIEQNFLSLQWNGAPGEEVQELVDDTFVVAQNSEVYKIFGLEARPRTSWATFKEEIAAKDIKNSVFVIEAIQNAVRSAFADGPTDNDQVFLSVRNDLYRVIVTRYYVYYDLSRIMHLYFIPFLSNKIQMSEENALSLLRMSSYIRSKFLVANSAFHYTQFEYYTHDRLGFVQLVNEAASALKLIQAACHNIGLDNPRRFKDFFGDTNELSNKAVADLYNNWNNENQKVLDCAAEIIASGAISESIVEGWTKTLKDFVSFAEPINRMMGDRALLRLQSWFSTGVI